MTVTRPSWPAQRPDAGTAPQALQVALAALRAGRVHQGAMLLGSYVAQHPPEPELLEARHTAELAALCADLALAGARAVVAEARAARLEREVAALRAKLARLRPRPLRPHQRLALVDGA